MDFKNGVKNIQTAGYNGTHTVFFVNSDIFYGLPPKMDVIYGLTQRL